MFQYKIIFFIIISFLSSFHLVVAADVDQLPKATLEVTEVLNNELTRESVANVLSGLSDKEVRELFKTQLNNLADQQLEIRENVPKIITLKDGLKKLKSEFINNYNQSLNLNQSIQKSMISLSQGRESYLGIFILNLFFCFSIALIVDFIIAKVLRYKISISLENEIPILMNKLTILMKLFFIRLFNLAVFYLIADSLISLLLKNYFEILTANILLEFIFTARLTFLLAALVLSPKNQSLRLYKLDDKKAKILTNRLIIISLISLSDVFMHWTRKMGVDPDESKIGFWLNFLFYAAIIWLVWRSRFIFEEMLLNGRERVSVTQMRIIKSWPQLVAVLSALVWFSLEYLMANYGLEKGLIEAAAFSVVFINFVPFINIAIYSITERCLPIDSAISERQINFQYEVQENVIKICQLFFASISLFGLAILWGIDFSDVSEEYSIRFFLAKFIELLALPILAYVAWLSVDTYIAYKLALEKPDEEDTLEEAEGGVGLSRMATVLPLLRISAGFIIVVVAVFGVFASLGINTTPLLAGASVVGLAVGFGAQTLVKDIVSGLFFLVDDAFRMGEYVDVGDVKGTVERIALRSLRLRHHLGPQHTIPYGEISKLTNFSRDWVIMKLRFRVPHDTDVNKVKRLFKNIGKDLLDHPELGKDFIAPFKSQGVLEVDEVGMLIRGKFTSKPGGQFMIRKEIYVRVQKVFAENNIEFAKRKIEVQIPDYIPNEIKHNVSAGASIALQEETLPVQK